MKKAVFFASALVILAGAAWFGRIGYRCWKQEHLIRQARYFLSQSDPTNAVLCLQQAVQSNPSNVEACRLFADLAETARSRNAIFWRRRVVELEPAPAQNRIDLARTSLLMGDFATANEALASVNEAGKKTAAYHKMAAALAWALNQFPEAEVHYQEAARLEPENLVSQIDLATVQLISQDAAKAKQGRSRLEALKTQPEVCCQALRQLALDAARNGAPDRAVSFSTELVENPHSIFSDRILRLDFLRQAKSPKFAPYLSTIQNESATNHLKAYDLGKWMFGQGQTNEAMAWIQTLPPAMQTNMPMPLLTAEGFATLGKWAELTAMLKGQDWKGLEYLRHACQSRALRATGNSPGAAVEWRNALKASGKRLPVLNDLVQKTAAWGWEPELDETLWTIVDNFPMEKGAFLLLYNRLFAAGNTPALHNLLLKTSVAVPSNTDLKNNLAMVSLLLNPREAKAYDLARDVYAKDPQNPFILSTYAYSLFLQLKADEALKLFDALPAQQLTNAAVATYYGIILAGSGQGPKARPYLDLAERAKLLPEERNLVKKARQGARSG